MFYKKCPRITFYTYVPVNPNHFLKKHHNRCTLVPLSVVTVHGLHAKPCHPVDDECIRARAGLHVAQKHSLLHPPSWPIIGGQQCTRGHPKKQVHCKKGYRWALPQPGCHALTKLSLAGKNDNLFYIVEDPPGIAQAGYFEGATSFDLKAIYNLFSYIGKELFFLCRY